MPAAAAPSTVQTPGQRYQAAVIQAVREGRGIKAQTDYLSTRVKGDAGILWYLFESYVEKRVRADLELAGEKARPKPHIVSASLASSVTAHPSTSTWQPPKLSTADISNALDQTWRHSKLYTHRINGQPLADTTGRELHQYIASHTRDNKFYQAIVVGIDPTDSRTLGEIYKGPEGAAEVEAAYQKAEQERKSS